MVRICPSKITARVKYIQQSETSTTHWCQEVSVSGNLSTLEQAEDISRSVPLYYQSSSKTHYIGFDLKAIHGVHSVIVFIAGGLGVNIQRDLVPYERRLDILLQLEGTVEFELQSIARYSAYIFIPLAVCFTLVLMSPKSI